MKTLPRAQREGWLEDAACRITKNFSFQSLPLKTRKAVSTQGRDHFWSLNFSSSLFLIALAENSVVFHSWPFPHWPAFGLFTWLLYLLSVFISIAIISFIHLCSCFCRLPRSIISRSVEIFIVYNLNQFCLLQDRVVTVKISLPWTAPVNVPQSSTFLDLSHRSLLDLRREYPPTSKMERRRNTEKNMPTHPRGRISGAFNSVSS